MITTHADLVYKCVIGDKDTFRMAFSLADKSRHYVQASAEDCAVQAHLQECWFLSTAMSALSSNSCMPVRLAVPMESKQQHMPSG